MKAFTTVILLSARIYPDLKTFTILCKVINMNMNHHTCFFSNPKYFRHWLPQAPSLVYARYVPPSQLRKLLYPPNDAVCCLGPSPRGIRTLATLLLTGKVWTRSGWKEGQLSSTGPSGIILRVPLSAIVSKSGISRQTWSRYNGSQAWTDNFKHVSKRRHTIALRRARIYLVT